MHSVELAGSSMPDIVKPLSDAARIASLARIADALGLPPSYFHTLGDKDFAATDQTNLDGGAVLTLVRAYLQSVDRDTRLVFVGAVKAFADEISS